jgi:hypothetical protein
MAPPRTPFDAVLHAARDVPRLDRALDAELLGTTLLGSVYAVADDNRAEAVREFVGGFLTATARRRTTAALTIRNVFARLVPAATGAGRVRPGTRAPAWVHQLGRVRLTGCYAYGDVYGDQTSYLATFAYLEPESGGPEHAVVALVDHNIGIVKDVFVSGPAGQILAEIRKVSTADPLTWFRTEDPGRLRGEVERHLRVTDRLGTLPAEGSLATDRTLAGARLALLPAGDAGTTTERAPRPPTTAERNALVAAFLDSPEAVRYGLDRTSEVDLASLHFCLSLLLDHSASFPDNDPLRWSPAVAGLFLLDWVHRRAVLDVDDAAILPRVIRAWAGYAGTRRGLPVAAIRQTDSAIEEMIPEFVRLYTTGERRSPATAVARLLADGIDLNDPVALETWFAANRERFDDEPA